MLISTRSAVTAARAACLVLVLAACSGDETPEELPFQDGDTSSVETEATPEPGARIVAEPDASPASSIDPVPVDDLFAAIDVDPELGECYSAVFADAGVTEITDLQDFADRSAELSPDAQAALAGCVE